jgi:hypothetical protein
MPLPLAFGGTAANSSLKCPLYPSYRWIPHVSLLPQLPASPLSLLPPCRRRPSARLSRHKQAPPGLPPPPAALAAALAPLQPLLGSPPRAHAAKPLRPASAQTEPRRRCTVRCSLVAQGLGLPTLWRLRALARGSEACSRCAWPRRTSPARCPPMPRLRWPGVQRRMTPGSPSARWRPWSGCAAPREGATRWSRGRGRVGEVEGEGVKLRNKTDVRDPHIRGAKGTF